MALTFFKQQFEDVDCGRPCGHSRYSPDNRTLTPFGFQAEERNSRFWQVSQSGHDLHGESAASKHELSPRL
jgi:hypothetical protein